METEKKKRNDVYAVVTGITLVLLVGVYFIGRSMADAGGSDADKELAEREAFEEKFAEAEKGVPFIEAAALAQKLKNGDRVRFVDIRSDEEYALEHIRDSMHLSPAALEGFSVNQGEVAVIIFSEDDINRFETAKNIFSRKSFPYLFLKGGISSWKGAGNSAISIGDPRLFTDQAKVYYLSPEDLAIIMNIDPESIFLIDVQPKSEYDKAHIKGAMNLPLDDLEKRIYDVKPPLAKTVVVYGATDVASFQAGVRIFDLGAMAVRTLSGNNNLSSESGLPIDRY